MNLHPNVLIIQRLVTKFEDGRKPGKTREEEDHKVNGQKHVSKILDQSPLRETNGIERERLFSKDKCFRFIRYSDTVF